MSDENVELVGRLFALWGNPTFVRELRDDWAWPEFRTELEGIFAPDCVCSWIGFGERVEAIGLDEQRAAWLDLLKPWDSVRTEAERLIPVADKVFALTRQHSRTLVGRKEARVIGADVYRVRNGRIASAEFYAKRAEGIEAAGGLPDYALPNENAEPEWPAMELLALDPRGTAMFTLPRLEVGLWMLTQGGKRVGLIRRAEAGFRLRTAAERWEAAIRRRGRIGWQLDFARTGGLRPAISYVPNAGLLEGGRMEVLSGPRGYRLRAPLIRNDWRLTGTTGGESVQIAFRNGDSVPAFRKHVQLDTGLACEPLLAAVILAASAAIVVHFEQPRLGGGGGG